MVDQGNEGVKPEAPNNRPTGEHQINISASQPKGWKTLWEKITKRKATRVSQQVSQVQHKESIRELAEQAESEGIQIPSVGRQERDSQGSEDWRTYLNSDVLRRAWNLPEGSPYAPYIRRELIASVDQLKDRIHPRFSNGERVTAGGIKRMIQQGVFNDNTAVILNSGGAHSIAMAVELVKAGYQPILMLDEVVDINNSSRNGEDLATLIYFAAQMDRLRSQIKPGAPPVFIFDAHRSVKRDTSGRQFVNDTFPRNLPSAEELRRRGLNRVIYLDEADANGSLSPYSPPSENQIRYGWGTRHSDLEATVMAWNAAGISVFDTGIYPHPGSPRNMIFHR